MVKTVMRPAAGIAGTHRSTQARSLPHCRINGKSLRHGRAKAVNPIVIITTVNKTDMKIFV